MRILLTLIFLTLLSAVGAASGMFQSPGGLPGALLLRREATPELAHPSGKLRLFWLDDRHLAIMGDYNDFLLGEIQKAYGKRLNFIDGELASGKIKDFSHRFLYNFAAIELMGELHPLLRDAFERKDHFTLTVDGRPMAIAASGSWIQALGLLRIPLTMPPGRNQITRAAELVHIAYLELKKPMLNGQKVEVTTRFGEHASTVFDDRSQISRAIKVNQEGYLSDAGRKYAYLGLWQGSLGELPVGSRAGEPFQLIDETTGASVYQGKITLRSPDQSITRNQQPVKLYGETVMEMDFSDFTRPGQYHIRIPGVGRSWSFVIGNDAIGRAFYVQMRGFFHQRSGIAKPPELTRWPMGADHMVSYQGGFVPNDRHYQDKTTRFKDKNNKNVAFRHFDMVSATRTEQALPEVHGGWWDAGDFDRRTYHFTVVDALLSVYLLDPGKFTDNQLDLPESGNGIPDIVDEAAWGVEVWRRAQNADGGVGCWLEATSHPENPDPEKDVQRYYLALPTRESTLEYAAYAAKLARAYQVAGRDDLSSTFRQSAERAWKFAMNPANRLKTSFTHPKLGPLTYEEPEELPTELRCKAALNLFLLTGDEAYESQLDDKTIQYTVQEIRNRLGPWFLSEFLEKSPYGKILLLRASQYRQMVLEEADKLLKSQQELAYRNVNWPLDSPYFTFLAWGQGLPLRRGMFFILAHQITGQKKYRDAALLLVDWMQGANPMGRTFTTGLGKVYPVRLLSLPNWVMSDRLLDPIPGLTIYGFDGKSFSISNASISMVYTLTCEPRRDHQFAGVNVGLLPHKLYHAEPMVLDDVKQVVIAEIPLWRRHNALESYAVTLNEFTVWETMAPAAAVYAALLPPGWKPPADWKKREPVRDKEQLPGYYFLP